MFMQDSYNELLIKTYARNCARFLSWMVFDKKFLQEIMQAMFMQSWDILA